MDLRNHLSNLGGFLLTFRMIKLKYVFRGMWEARPASSPPFPFPPRKLKLSFVRTLPGSDKLVSFATFETKCIYRGIKAHSAWLIDAYLKDGPPSLSRSLKPHPRYFTWPTESLPVEHTHYCGDDACNGYDDDADGSGDQQKISTFQKLSQAAILEWMRERQWHWQWQWNKAIKRATARTHKWREKFWGTRIRTSSVPPVHPPVFPFFAVLRS